jgi:hypothetical protein
LASGGFSSAEEFVAADGQVLNRDFDSRRPPPTNVLCTDDERYEKQARAFVDYVLPDRSIKIVPWREAPPAEDIEHTHLVYLGHPPENTSSLDCLTKYPVMSAFVELVRDYAPRTMKMPAPTPALDGLPITSQGFDAPPNLMPMDSMMSVYFCYPEDSACAFDMLVSVFGLDGPTLCSDKAVCDRIMEAIRREK